MVRAFQNIYGQVRECLGPDSRRTLREGKLPAAFHRLARAIDANRALAAFVALILFGLIAGGAMFHTTSAIAAGGGGIGSPGSVVTPIAVPTDDDDRSATPKSPGASATDALAATDDASTSDDHLKNVNQSDPDAVKKAEEKKAEDDKVEAMKAAADTMVYTEDGKSGKRPMHNMTGTWQGMLSLLVFIGGYTAAIMEESVGHGFKKSIPVTLAAGIIWVLVALGYREGGHSLYFVTTAARHNLTEFVEVFLFLLCAMTFINTMHRLNVFNRLRWFLVESGFSYRSCFWITGLIAFWLSPIADNLTTAVLMGAVISNLGHGYDEYVSMCCVNIVVAANAGGAFSPFGDLTTLMVWQKGKVRLEEFPGLLAPAVVNWLVPAFLMNRRIKDAVPPRVEGEVAVALLPGAVEVILLFVATVFMTACFHSYAHLPPVLGMMTGLGMLKVYGWWRGRALDKKNDAEETSTPDDEEAGAVQSPRKPTPRPSSAEPDGGMGGRIGGGDGRKDHALDIFKRLEQTEWDTLIFFYGVIMCVGGLGVMGYLSALSTFMYGNFGPNVANVVLGALSAVIDNIPMTYAVLQTDPLMTTTQWLLLTLTAGVGGSLLSVGSAAGVGLMGVNSRCYTFRSHLKWTPAVALGYLASVIVHLIVNGFE